MSIKRIIFSSIIFILSELLVHLMCCSVESRICKWHFERIQGFSASYLNICIYLTVGLVPVSSMSLPEIVCAQILCWMCVLERDAKAFCSLKLWLLPKIVKVFICISITPANFPGLNFSFIYFLPPHSLHSALNQLALQVSVKETHCLLTDIGAIHVIYTRISNKQTVFTVNAFYFRCSALGTGKLPSESAPACPFLDYSFSPGRKLWISFSLYYCFFFLCSCLSFYLIYSSPTTNSCSSCKWGRQTLTCSHT